MMVLVCEVNKRLQVAYTHALAQESFMVYFQ